MRDRRLSGARCLTEKEVMEYGEHVKGVDLGRIAKMSLIGEDAVIQ